MDLHKTQISRVYAGLCPSEARRYCENLYSVSEGSRASVQDSTLFLVESFDLPAGNLVEVEL